ncbi:SDR family NAD(P)-dependent oxidoreductase [Oceanobacillus halophilus]|uniref:SDR family oxidoreductase n=1 Tax=Oceanobacillus halophilus TaxID=930130 RepID=A0A494ZZ39_9BACI|nr:SDR family oxidoreductase [Oceanobacillus halophilus]RKQ31402.1 SDR family oxidoreductase [Oceanobacillus halophilus]
MPTIAITGAGSGLGEALSYQYAKHGYKVYLLGRNDNKLQLVKNNIRKNGGQSEIILCDVSEPASVSIAFQQIDQLDVFINNAGIGIFGPIENYRTEEMEVLLDTNVKGTILAVQSALPIIQENNGRILNIISTAGLRGKVNESIYCASKFAVRGFTESLQKELENQPVTITAVYMGGMNTPFWNQSTHVADPTKLKGPELVAEQIFQEDDGRKEIFVDK